MTVEVFRQDGYVFQFEAEVVRTDGDSVVLDSTAFYPGGGGQVCDTGTLRGLRVTDVTRRDGEIVHTVPGNDLRPGDRVWGSVDWERRYDLMKGHTAEHLLFGALSRYVPDIGIVKIFISPESKYVVVDRDVPWDAVRDAVAFCNRAIHDNLTVRRVVMDRGDPDLSSVRMDLERIKGDEISVTQIGDVDAAACSGIHVMETGEIGALLVDRKVSAGKEGLAVHFRIGRDAMDSAMDLANACLRVSEAMDSKPEDAVKAACNLRDEAASLRAGLKEMVSRSVASGGETVDGTRVVSGIYPEADGRIFMEISETLRKDGCVSVLLSVGSRVSVFVSSGSGTVDAGALLKDVLPGFGGRGGGRREFAQGGVPDPSRAEELMDSLLSGIRGTVTRQSY